MPSYVQPSTISCLCLTVSQVLMVTVPLIKKSHFDRDSNLPPVRMMMISPVFTRTLTTVIH